MADRPSSIALRWLIAGTMAGVVLGSVGIAVAQTDESTTTTAPSSSSSAPATPADPTNPASPAQPDRRPRKAELTGETADKVKAAALAAVPGGTVGHMHEGRDGGYVAIVTKSDGTRVAVKLDESFNVTSIEEGGACHHGGGGRGPRPAELTGEAADKVKAAALAAVPGATVNHMHEGRDGGYVALITKSDGTRAIVKLDDSFNVTSVEDKLAREGRGPRRGPPPAQDGGDGGTAEGSATTTNV